MTKFVVACPAQLTIDAAGFARLTMDHVVSKFGVPASIISDRDTRFTSAFFATWTKCLGSTQCLSTAFHPQTDGQTERMNRLLQETLRHFVCFTQNNWDEYLQVATFAINNSTNVSTTFTPFFLNYGRHPRHPSGIAALPAAKELSPVGLDYHCNIQTALATAKSCLKTAQSNQKNQVDKHRLNVTFAVGDKVLLSTKYLKLKAGPTWARHKLLPKFIGPFTILSTITAPYHTNGLASAPIAAKLDLPATTRIHPVFHVSLLCHWKDPVLDPSAQVLPQPLDWLDGNPEFQLEALLDHKWIKTGGRKRLFFLVKWAGFLADNTWEAKSSLLTSVPNDVHAYEQSHDMSPVPLPTATNNTNSTIETNVTNHAQLVVVPPAKLPSKLPPVKSVSKPLQSSVLPSSTFGRQRRQPARLAN